MHAGHRHLILLFERQQFLIFLDVFSASSCIHYITKSTNENGRGCIHTCAFVIGLRPSGEKWRLVKSVASGYARILWTEIASLFEYPCDNAAALDDQGRSDKNQETKDCIRSIARNRSARDSGSLGDFSSAV